MDLSRFGTKQFDLLLENPFSKVYFPQKQNKRHKVLLSGLHDRLNFNFLEIYEDFRGEKKLISRTEGI